MGGKGKRAALPFQDSKKRKRAEFKYKAEPRHAKFFKEWRGANLYVFAPNPPMRAQSHAVFEEHYKTAGWLPRPHKKAPEPKQGGEVRND